MDGNLPAMWDSSYSPKPRELTAAEYMNHTLADQLSESHATMLILPGFNSSFRQWRPRMLSGIRDDCFAKIKR
jgi:hypothetical protein